MKIKTGVCRHSLKFQTKVPLCVGQNGISIFLNNSKIPVQLFPIDVLVFKIDFFFFGKLHLVVVVAFRFYVIFGLLILRCARSTTYTYVQI